MNGYKKCDYCATSPAKCRLWVVFPLIGHKPDVEGMRLPKFLGKTCSFHTGVVVSSVDRRDKRYIRCECI